MSTPIPRRRAVLLLATVVTALAGVACGGAPAAPSPPAPVPRTPAAPPVTSGGGGVAVPSRCTSAHLTVTLVPADAGAGSVYRAVCRPTPVRGLRVYPPGSTTAVFVPAEGTGCAGTPRGPQLTVRTIAAR